MCIYASVRVFACVCVCMCTCVHIHASMCDMHSYVHLMHQYLLTLYTLLLVA